MNDVSTPVRAVSATFPMVGIGASAGGLEAIIELLSNIPAGSGMALLVVQHLDPSHASLLADILSRKTTLRVKEATDQALIEIDHVYVIPPNTSMSVLQGHLQLKPRSQTMGPPMPVDDLLESLARDQGGNAIGIILSGSGTDGAIGMLALKENGGITFAQDETSARFTSMPRAAIGLGCVDLVLAPAAIAQELRRMARHPFLTESRSDAAAGSSEAADEDDLRKLFRQLRNICNVDFSHYKRGTVERRLERRLVLHSLDSVAAYLPMLEADPAEAHALCRDLLIRYTEFFRDPEAFEALADTVFPRLLLNADPVAPIRIWVPGCATGEEVYSIAICLLETMAGRSLNRPLQIFGTDVSEEALETARNARYIENIARNVSPDRLQRFFTREGDHYRVAKQVRDCCTFARQNVAYDPPFSRIDLISCRNLLIYLDPVLQKRVLPAFHFALQHDGVLMLGLSETVGAYSDLFSVIESRRGKLFGKRLVPNRPFVALALPLASRRAAAAPGASAAVSEMASAEALRLEINRVALARFVPPCVLCDEGLNVLEFRGDTGAFLANPPGAPTTQLQRLARPGVFLAISDAVRQVQRSGAPVRKTGLRIEVDGQLREASLEVMALQPAKVEGRWFLIFFSAMPAVPEVLGKGGQATRGQVLKSAILARIAGRGAAPHDGAREREIVRLNEELRATRDQIRVMLEEHETAIEELKTLEEETLSSNEEFQSTNEELETAKEELQSLNEELTTTNDELRFRNRELKIVHDEAAQARDYADAIIETMPGPLLVLDADFRVVRGNQAFYNTFKTSPGETLNGVLYSLGSGQWNIPALRVLLEELLPQQTQVRAHEISAEFPQLGRRTMRLNAARVDWPQRPLILLAIEDVTERNQALQHLTEEDRQKDEFLALLAHELRNPLAAMSSALQLLKHQGARAELKQHAQATLERQLRNQVRMVDDLLDVSRITRGIVVLRIERFDFAQTVRQCRDELAEQIAARGHTVTLALPEFGLAIDGDPTRLEQAVTNLLGNAIKYTPPGGRIELALERQGNDAVLTVTDSGVGMTEEFLGRVFQVFVQAEKSIDRHLGGLGIGLAVVRRLVEVHGGTVQARSQGLAQGSRFIVRLPLIGRRHAAPPAHSAASLLAGADDAMAAAVAAAARRVLVVEDNLDSARGTAALLELDGYEVRLAHDGLSALKAVQDFNPDAVLLDVGLPGMNGYEVCRRLRALAGREQTLVIGISGYGQREDVAVARKAGFDYHLTKPADPQQLARYLRGGR